MFKYLNNAETKIIDTESGFVYFKNTPQWLEIISSNEIEPAITEWETGYIERCEAQSYLSRTDWYVIRSFEEGIPIPLTVLEQRKINRLICDNTQLNSK